MKLNGGEPNVIIVICRVTAHVVLLHQSHSLIVTALRYADIKAHIMTLSVMERLLFWKFMSGPR